MTGVQTCALPIWYSEYRYAFDSVHGAMRSSLDFWHMGRQFASRPLLNESFVMSNPTTRVFPVEDNSDKLIVQSYCKFTAVRPVAKFGDRSNCCKLTVRLND